MLRDNKNILRFSGVTFLLGIFSASYLPVFPSTLHYWAAVVFLIIVAGFTRNPWWRLPGMFIFGGLWLTFYLQLTAPAQLPSSLDSREVVVTGKVVSIPQNNGRRSRFDFLIQQVNDSEEQWQGKVRLSWYETQHELIAGQQWRLRVKLKPVHGFSNPGGFDYEAWMVARGVSATGYVRKADSATLLGHTPGLDTLRQKISREILRQLPDGAHAGLLVALSTGDRQYIEPAQWQVMTRTGTVHLMAISGLHIGLIYGLFYWLGRTLWRSSARLCTRYPAQDFAVVLGLLAALVYAAMAGFAIPTQRALIMLAVIAMALLSRRMTSPLDILQAALLVVLLIDPLAIISAGFWLSFAAVAIILMTLDRQPDRQAAPAWSRLMKIQWVLAIGLLPLTSLFFSQVSLVAPVTNLLAVPWTGLLIVPLSLAGAVLTWFSPFLAEVFLNLADWLMQWLWAVLAVASDSPYAVMHPASPGILALVAGIAGLLMVILLRRNALRLAGLVMLTPLLLSASTTLKNSEYQVDFLDVGQGLAVVVRTAEHTLLFDAGFSNDSGFDIGQRVILPYLWHQGIRKLDHVVLSHDDRDHVGGFDSIAREFSPTQLTVMPGSRYLDSGLASTACRAGQQWQWDGVNFEFLHPGEDPGGKDNNRSCVLRISSPGGSVLLTGDIERSIEQLLVRQFPKRLDADILLAPHHGSATSSSAAFIRAVRPLEVVYTAGFRNRFGFPKASVRQRYEEAGVRQWNTSDTGMLRYRFKDRAGDHSRSIYREQTRRLWHSYTEHDMTK